MSVLLGNNTNETEQARIDFEKRMTEKAATAQKVLSELSTWMWKCDTPTSDQIENETYIQFKELLQVRAYSSTFYTQKLLKKHK